jgi:hypothetical protein
VVASRGASTAAASERSAQMRARGLQVFALVIGAALGAFAGFGDAQGLSDVQAMLALAAGAMHNAVARAK